LPGLAQREGTEDSEGSLASLNEEIETLKKQAQESATALQESRAELENLQKIARIQRDESRETARNESVNRREQAQADFIDAAKSPKEESFPDGEPKPVDATEEVEQVRGVAESLSGLGNATGNAKRILQRALDRIQQDGNATGREALELADTIDRAFASMLSRDAEQAEQLRELQTKLRNIENRVKRDSKKR